MGGTKGQTQSGSLTRHVAAQLVAGYSEESVLYQMLFGLTSRQRRCLGDGGSLVEFVELTDQKDAVLGQIEQLESEIEPLRACWLMAPPARREKLAEQLNPLFDEVVNTIQKTVTVEQDNERLLETRRRELAQALADAHKWRSRAPGLIPSQEPSLAPATLDGPVAAAAV